MQAANPAPATPRFLAVLYAFAIFSGGERRLVTEEEVPASTRAMLLPQLNASAKRTRVDQGPGLLIFDNYRDALQAAQALATIATTVEVREVAPASGLEQGTWTGASGGRYRTLPGGLVQRVKE